MNIYVGNLPYTATEDELRSMFEEHGPVSRVNIINDRETGRSKGFGFVEMENKADGEDAIKAIDGSSMGGRNLRINEARPREDRPRGGPGGGGGGGRRF
ncbi:MAG: RNA-binding protein [Pseudomonadaceae bacterium]|nr:RNA-binding protein [Pseudomonadaceae bacterium]